MVVIQQTAVISTSLRTTGSSIPQCDLATKITILTQVVIKQFWVCGSLVEAGALFASLSITDLP